MMEWRKVKLGEVLNFRRGHDLPHEQMAGGNIPVAGSNGVIGYHNIATPISPILTIGRSGNVGTPYFYEHAWAHNTTLYVDDFKGNDPTFLYYLCKTIPFSAFGGGSAVPTLNRNHIHPLEVLFPTSLPIQRRIASILSSLDAQIENNNRINRNLEAQAQALFKSWFVDFAPWGGAMPDGWREGNIYDVAEILDKKRVPLSGMEREKMKKIYPYYGATSIMDYVEKYIFDGRYTLLGEDGSVVQEDGTPYVQYVWGKFWVNNHAHVLIGKNGFSTELLYVWLKQINIIPLVTGAVQAKLSQSNMQKMHITIPDDEFLQKICSTLDGLFAQIRNNTEANARLASLRDTLLPKLMKGEIEV